ncbi:MAG: hypothetical protein M3178_16240 [Pseudomonadota bacterium]|nr:hypothetical protein [Pseudomonadota bacterium]
MFSLFRRRLTLDDMWAVGVPVVFESMKEECPGTAFLFAGTIRNYQELKPAIDSAARIQNAEIEMAHLRSLGGPGDKACYLGLRFVKTSEVSLRSRDKPVRMLISRAIRDIVPFAITYRNLEPRDYQTPPSEIVRLSLEKQNFKCVADCILAVVADYNASPSAQPDSISCSETVETLLANFDACAEWENGSCKTYFARLNSIIPDERPR